MVPFKIQINSDDRLKQERAFRVPNSAKNGINNLKLQCSKL